MCHQLWRFRDSLMHKISTNMRNYILTVERFSTIVLLDYLLKDFHCLSYITGENWRVLNNPFLSLSPCRWHPFHPCCLLKSLGRKATGEQRGQMKNNTACQETTISRNLQQTCPCILSVSRSSLTAHCSTGKVERNISNKIGSLHHADLWVPLLTLFSPNICDHSYLPALFIFL